MKQLARLAFSSLFGTAARLGWYWPFVKILTRVIEARDSAGAPPAADAYTLLALMPESFRGDLDILAASGRIRVLQVPNHWQTRLMYLFYPNLPQAQIDMNPAPGAPQAKCKERLQRFYEGVLPAVYARLDVDCVLSSHLRWPADVDWGIASKNIGVPYVILYREGLFAASEELRSSMPRRFKLWGDFPATHMVVHNDIGRQYCVDVGYIAPERVSSLGCLRMDSYIQRIRTYRPSEGRPKKLVLFPPNFFIDFGVDTPIYRAIQEIPVTLAKFAKMRPEVEVVFKSKPKDYPNWRALIDRSFVEAGLSAHELPNLNITADLDAQELILESTVVAGLNSTAILEAAIAGKPVVVPYFSDLRQPQFERTVKFIDALQYLDVADDEAQFVQLIEQRLEDPMVSAESMKRRAEMFAKYVSDPDGGAVERYLALFERLIEETKGSPAGAAAGRLKDDSVGPARESLLDEAESRV
jgi:hypothetical protein